MLSAVSLSGINRAAACKCAKLLARQHLSDKSAHSAFEAVMTRMGNFAQALEFG